MLAQSVLYLITSCDCYIYYPIIADCSIRENDTVSSSPYPPNFTGLFVYKLSCDAGTVTSVRARGFCHITAHNQTVELEIFNATFEFGAFEFFTTTVKANCDTNAVNGTDNYYGGYVSADDVNIRIPSGGLLGVHFHPRHKSNNTFLPAVINKKTSNYAVSFITDALKTTDPNFTLLFSATIVTG